MSSRILILARRCAVILAVVLVAIGLPIVRGSRAPRAVLDSIRVTGSGVVRAPRPFSLFGVTWPAGAGAPRLIRARTTNDGRRWSRWVTLEDDPRDAPDAGREGAGVRSTSPLWVSRARSVDLRFTGHVPPNAKVHFVDPGDDPSPSLPVAEAWPPKPRFISRAAWGADESIRKCCPRYAEPLQMAIIHHTATANSYSKDDSKRIVRAIYEYHVKANGWDDIGYNMLVDKYGQFFEGRKGGLDRPVIGAHAKGFNTHSTGIAYIGTVTGSRPSGAAMDALKRVIAWRFDQAFVDPRGGTTMVSGGSTRWDAGERVSLKTISAHRDVGKTSCPGDGLYASLPWLRSEVAKFGDPKLLSPALSRTMFTPNGDGLADTVELKAKFSSTVGWTISALGPDGKVWRTWKGNGSKASAKWDGKNGSGVVAPQDTYRLRITGKNGHGTVRKTDFPVKLIGYPDGTLLKMSDGWYGVLMGQKLRHPVTKRALETRYGTSEAISVPKAVKGLYHVGSDIGFRDGSVLRSDGKLWIVSDGKRRAVSSGTLSALGYPSGSVIDVPSSALEPHPVGSEVTLTGGRPNGTALRATDGKEALILGGSAKPFRTRNVRTSYRVRDVDRAGPADPDVAASQNRAPVGFRDGTLLRKSGSSQIYVISNGKRRAVSSRRFEAIGYRSTNVRVVGADELALNPEGKPL